ncbi:MAG: preprotein translocase subunit SecE [Planctomycetota bacterium]
MTKYKPDQGTHARTISLLLLSGMLLFGVHSLYYFLTSFRGSPAGSGFLVQHLSADPVPVVGLHLTWSLLIATLVGVAGVWLLMRLLNRPKIADLLIDSETEMRKCTWPTWAETVKSSMVILVVMLFFTAVLAAFDLGLNELMTGVVFG